MPARARNSRTPTRLPGRARPQGPKKKVHTNDRAGKRHASQVQGTRGGGKRRTGGPSWVIKRSALCVICVCFFLALSRIGSCPPLPPPLRKTSWDNDSGRNDSGRNDARRNDSGRGVGKGPTGRVAAGGGGGGDGLTRNDEQSPSSRAVRKRLDFIYAVPTDRDLSYGVEAAGFPLFLFPSSMPQPCKCLPNQSLFSACRRTSRARGRGDGPSRHGAQRRRARGRSDRLRLPQNLRSSLPACPEFSATPFPGDKTFASCLASLANHRLETSQVPPACPSSGSASVLSLKLLP